ncbi:hypothetical protein [Pusillimonas sp. ANT_WB101]|uniref:hypothetical protein n=1 Tax=Pusillimonas sp. ANT_WB101 TaxID=2597356 RepID=UPI002106EA6D|nr:hypothetical protein [Pusillimonas sp. ANT_WB101]
MKATSLQQQQPTRQDHTLLRNTLLKLTARQKILCVVIIVVVAIIWYNLLTRLVLFGRGIDYNGLHALGVQAVALLNQYNPFFWWAVVALCTLIIAYFLYGFVQSTNRQARAKLVDEDTIAQLSQQLSPPALEVLRWSWDDRRRPICVGDLQRAAAELRAGRSGKITLARRHAALLGQRGTAVTSVEPVYDSIPVTALPSEDNPG